jgi:hypothetical protein
MGWEWLGGLFEGEGHIALTGRNSVSICINMTDEDVIRKAHEVAGGIVSGPYSQGRHKPLWRWGVNRSEDVLVVLQEIEPYLGERRRARVLEAYKRLKGVRRNGYCKRGHPMSGDNLYVSPKGQRHCRTCSRDRDHRRIKT